MRKKDLIWLISGIGAFLLNLWFTLTVDDFVPPNPTSTPAPTPTTTLEQAPPEELQEVGDAALAESDRLVALLDAKYPAPEAA